LCYSSLIVLCENEKASRFLIALKKAYDAARAETNFVSGNVRSNLGLSMLIISEHGEARRGLR
jgi:hypothetical protein